MKDDGGRGPMSRLEQKGTKIKDEVRGVEREDQRSFACCEVRSFVASKIDSDLPLLTLFDRGCVRYIRGCSNGLFDNFDATKE